MATMVTETAYPSPTSSLNRLQFWMRLLIAISLAVYAFFLLDLVLHPFSPGGGPVLADDGGVIFRYSATLAGAFNILVGLLVWRRSPGNLLGGLLIVWGAAAAGWGIRSEWSSPQATGLAYLVFFTFFYGLGWPSIVAFLYLYPSGHFYPPRFKNLAVGLLLIQAVLGLSANLSTPAFENTSRVGEIPNPLQLSWLQEMNKPLNALNSFAAFVVLFIPLVTLVLRFRNASHRERQQIKWLVWLAAVTTVITNIFFFIWPYSEAVQNLPLATQIITFVFLILFYNFPALASLIAIVRYRLWDIDILIRRTLVYSTLTGLLGFIYFGGVALLQNILTTYGGLSASSPRPVVIVLTTLAIAALFNPLRKRIQDFIDRRFYRQKYDAEKALAGFAEITRGQTDIDSLMSSMTGLVQTTLQPESTSLWIQKG